MTLRARPARWFESLIPRPSVARAVEILAATGQVQLEQDRANAQPLTDFSALGGPLETYRALRQRYLGYWPEPQFRPGTKDSRLEKRLEEALKGLQRWVDSAAPHVQRVESLRHDRHELRRLTDFLSLVLDRTDLDLATVAGAHTPLASVLLVVEEHASVPEMSEQIVVARAEGVGVGYLLALGPEAAIRELTQGAGGREARRVSLPAWLAGTPPQALADVTQRIVAMDREIEQEYAALAELSAHAELALILGELRRLEWFARHLEGIPVSEYLARVTGWTNATDPAALAQPLQSAGIPAVLNFIPAPRGMYPPTLSENPKWARPFELFLRLAGTPGRNEADPTLVVAVIAPFLFGYMFADVGQGAVLLVAGLVLRRRWPVLGLLIPGGLLAMGFGLLFGSVFCREDILAPLWLAPLEHPLVVLGLPLAAGAVLILLGLLLNGLEEHWAGRGRAWLETDAGIIVLYLGLLVALFHFSAGLLLAAAGASWFALGSALQARRHRLQSLAAHAAELLERLLQLAVNSVSFVRVGAFAIAHAGLAAAVTSLAVAAGGDLSGLLVQLTGNVLILVLEGLVVSVQTTRLILFEFFVRFMRAGGRPFRALAPPSAN